MTRRLLHCIAVLVPLLVISSVIRSLDRWGYYGFATSTMKHLVADGGQYDTLFVGSSRFFRGVNPLIFDAECELSGQRTKSFNAAQPGAAGHEVSVILHDLLATMPRPPKHMVIEVVHWDPRIAKQNLMADRTLLWHTLRETWYVFGSMALHAPANSQPSMRARAVLGWAHVEHLVRNTFRVGRGWAITMALLGPADAKTVGLSKIRRRGWAPYRVENEAHVRRAHAFERDMAEGYVAYATALAANLPDDSRYELNWPAMHAQIAFLRERGIEPVYVIAPAPRPRLSREERDRLAALVPLMDYSDPRVWPQFFEPSVRFDGAHLNTEGAGRFSRQLARDCARLRAASRGK